MPNRIRDLRTAAGLSLEDLARATGTSNQQISRLEKGERRLTEDWMKRISSALNVPPTALFDDAPQTAEVAQNVEEALLLIVWRLADENTRRAALRLLSERGQKLLLSSGG